MFRICDIVTQDRSVLWEVNKIDFDKYIATTKRLPDRMAFNHIDVNTGKKYVLPEPGFYPSSMIGEISETETPFREASEYEKDLFVNKQVVLNLIQNINGMKNLVDRMTMDDLVTIVDRLNTVDILMTGYQ